MELYKSTITFLSDTVMNYSMEKDSLEGFHTLEQKGDFMVWIFPGDRTVMIRTDTIAIINTRPMDKE